MRALPQAEGTRGFMVLWSGQAVSLLGSAMTAFALPLWVYEQTNTATSVAIAGTFASIPLLLLTPLAGVLVDRADRKRMLMLSDAIGGMVTLGLLLSATTGHLALWQVYLAAAAKGCGQAFQWPAYSATVPLMVPRGGYSRVNGLTGLIETGTGIVAPGLAAALLPWVGLTGILLVDAASFLFAVASLLLVRVPTVAPHDAAPDERLGVGGDVWFGLRFIVRRPGLLGIQSLLLVTNTLFGIAYVVLVPMLMTRTHDQRQVAAVQSAMAVGAVCGGVLLSIWGGPRRRVTGLFGGLAVAGGASVVMGVGSTTLLWVVSAFVRGGSLALINNSNQSLYHAKVPPALQGRVFATRRLISWASGPLTPLIGGPLADRVLEPTMQAPGAIPRLLAPLVGSGPGTGMAMLFVLAGCAVVAVIGVARRIPAIRDVEDHLPDHDGVVVSR